MLPKFPTPPSSAWVLKCKKYYIRDEATFLTHLNYLKCKKYYIIRDKVTPTSHGAHNLPRPFYSIL